MRKSRMLGAGMALSLALGAAQAAETDRTTQEAVALFRFVPPLETPPSPCLYDREWDRSSTIPEYLAREIFGVTWHAELLPPDSLTSPGDFLDPQKRHPEAFCSKTEREVFEKAQFAAFETNTSAMYVRVKWISYSFPIFDADYTKAAIITDVAEDDRDRLNLPTRHFKPGAIMRHPREAITLLKIYVKTNGSWKLTRTEILGQS